MNLVVTFGILFLFPLAAIGAVLYLDTGIDPALFYDALKTSAILIVVGGLISFAASRLSERSSS